MVKEFDTEIITSKFENCEVKESRTFITILVRTDEDRDYTYDIGGQLAASANVAYERVFTSKSTLPIMMINHQ